MQNGRTELHTSLPRERPLARDHLVEDETQCPDVTADIGGLTTELLGCHVWQSAKQRAGLRHRRVGLGRGLGQRLARCSLGQPEVQHLHCPVFPHLDVRGLQVAVDDTSFVSGFECLSDLLGYRQSFIQRNRALLDPVSQRRPLDQLQHQRTGIVTFLNAVDLRDVRMVQAGKNLRLSLEPCQPIRI